MKLIDNAGNISRIGGGGSAWGTSSSLLLPNSSTEQLRLAYSPSFYADFTVSSAGNLAIAPNGGSLSLTGILVCGAITSSGVITGTSFSGAGTGLTGTAASLTAGAANSVAASNITGTTLASNVLSSSLTSVGTLASLTVTNPISGSVTGSSGSTAGNAASATLTAITDDTTTASVVYPTWVTGASGNLAQKTSATKLNFVPSTGILFSAAGFSGGGFFGPLTTSGDVQCNNVRAVGSGGALYFRDRSTAADWGWYALSGAALWNGSGTVLTISSTGSVGCSSLSASGAISGSSFSGSGVGLTSIPTSSLTGAIQANSSEVGVGGLAPQSGYKLAVNGELWLGGATTGGGTSAHTFKKWIGVYSNSSGGAAAGVYYIPLYQ